MEHAQESPLTQEILFNIFGSLTQEDLKSCFLVSKLWRLVGFKDEFGWQTVSQVSYSSAEIIKRGVIDITNVEIETMPFQAQKHYTKFSVKAKGSENGITIFGGNILQHWNELSTHPKLWFFGLEGLSDKYELNLQVNIRQLERLFAAGEPIPGIQLIVDYFPRIYVPQFKSQLKNKLTEARTKAGLPLIGQPPHLTHETKLSQYQLDAISWMKSVEDAGAREVTYSTLVRLPTMPCNILFDLANKKLVAESEAPNYLCTETMNAGGILADDKQLGKTMEIIGLILANPNTTKIEQLPKYSIEDLNTVPLVNLLFPTKATLVVCPDYANAMHWVSEIATHVTTDVKVVYLLSEVIWNKTTYQDLIDADIVLISMELILHNLYQYKCTVDVDQPFPNPKYRLLTGEIPIRQLKAVHLDPDRGMGNKAPLVRHFTWHRMIVDEGQAILGSESCIALLFSKYRWFVSSAPMPAKTDQFAGLLSFFRLKKCPLPLVSVFTFITQNLVWRNTRESIKNEYQVSVETNNQVAFFDYSPKEEEMIASANFPKTYVKALRFPTSNSMLLINHLPEYEQHAKNMFAPIAEGSKTDRYIDAKITLATMAEKDENELLQDLKERGIPVTTTKKKKLKALLKAKLQDEIEQYEKNIPETNGHNHTLTATKRKAAENDTMELELGTKKPKIETIVAGTNASAKETGFGSYLEETFGTKIAFLLNYVLRPMWKVDPKTRFLIFSSYQYTLEYVDQVLESFGVSAIRTFGLHKEVIKDRVRQAHARSPTRVALVVFGHTVPQIKPFGATHVIFLEPIFHLNTTTDITQPSDIECKAISHAHIRGRKAEIPVIRLIARNSLEHAYAVHMAKHLPVAHTFSQEFIDTVIHRKLHVFTDQQTVYAKSAARETRQNGKKGERRANGSTKKFANGFGDLGSFRDFDSNGNGHSASFGNYDSDEDD